MIFNEIHEKFSPSASAGFCGGIKQKRSCSYPLQRYQSEWRAKSPAGTCRFRRLMIQTSLLRFTIRSRIKTRNIKKSSCVTDPLLRGGHFWKLSVLENCFFAHQAPFHAFSNSKIFIFSTNDAFSNMRLSINAPLSMSRMIWCMFTQ